MRALVLLLALLAAAPALARPGELRAFGDWQLGCDLALACRAIGFAADPDALGQVVILDRAAWPDAAPRVTLGLGDGPAPPPGSAVVLEVDGVALATLRMGETLLPLGPFSPSAALAAPDDGMLATLADPRPLLAALVAGRGLVLRGADGRALSAVPLTGGAAALLAMDEAQGRVGTVTALARPGPRPADTVPPAPAPPAAPPARAVPDDAPRSLPPAMRAALARYAEGCDLPAAAALDGAMLHRLAPGLLLVGLPCEGGAYNTPFAFRLWRDGAGDAGPAPIEPPPGDADPEPTNPRWNAATGTLTARPLGRRFGDCGTTGSWAWDGARFRLAEWWSMPVCRGLPSEWWFRLR